jgi:hypothetical protein
LVYIVICAPIPDMASKSTNFNWIKARADCSVAQVFKQLELGARNDVEAANEQRKSEEHHVFSVSAEPGRFSVVRGSRNVHPVSVDFSLEGEEIAACVGNEIKLTATITLNNEGRCMLKVNDEELEQWQVRRTALEDLFFGKSGS